MFRPVSVSDNGEVSNDTVFRYKQTGNIVSCSYSGTNIIQGHLLGIVAMDGSIDMRYHQVNSSGSVMTGICSSRPEVLPSGKIRLHEEWQWTTGNKSKGSSVLEEV
jgi:hypothetical protein